jgi:hypothetical protein
MSYTVNSIATYLDDSISENWTRSSINDFNYLLKFISEGEFEYFSKDNLREIAKNANKLIKKIDEELSQEILTEEERFRISHTTAVGNMESLKEIISSIQAYFNMSEEERLQKFSPKKKTIWDKVKSFFSS